MLKLYSYFRSSSAYRVRIALNLKDIEYRLEPVNLLKSEEQQTRYLSINPQGLVPALTLPNGQSLNQSMAILEWLETAYPQVPLLPDDPMEAARVRSLCYSIACDIQPLNNLRVLNYLKGPMALSEEQSMQWYRHWIKQGFDVIEKAMIASPFASGSEPGWVDVLLIPQVYNALRFQVDLAGYPAIDKIHRHCNKLKAFQAAHPDNQPDKPVT